ncbi:uncharacterized protein LOC126676574 [Mercurialis annua]|uniref:uncharacterized protein LOC126676574 n=1 Tax=Mercurialis annua TaxID=3986 RepID=UPI00215F25F0|nr:uncharacterized protein LOC126676574 [Mercurialis annua]
MAIEFCSDTNASPRISFSHDLCISDIVPIEQQHPTLRSNSIGSVDFDFCTRKSFDQDSSSADELFSDGKILPTEIKKKNKSSSLSAAKQADVLSDDSSKKEKLSDEAEEKQSNTKSFWRFKRSSSSNCVSGYGRSLCPLPLLSRSNSTGSTPVKRASLSRENSNHKQQKQPFIKSSSSNYQKPPLKKGYGSNYGNGSVRVNPVLNVPSANLFGLGSIFFNNGKDKSRKK